MGDEPKPAPSGARSVPSPSHVLYLLRHAKSSWDDPDLPDHGRPLAPQGQRAARRMAERIARLPVQPTLVLCSSAVRALQTYEPIAAALGGGVELSVEDALYAATSDVLLSRLQDVTNRTEVVLLIGHNPGLQELVVSLAGGGVRHALARARAKLPPGALAVLRVQGPWASLGPGRAYLQSLITPR